MNEQISKLFLCKMHNLKYLVLISSVFCELVSFYNVTNILSNLCQISHLVVPKQQNSCSKTIDGVTESTNGDPISENTKWGTPQALTRGQKVQSRREREI